MLFVIPAKSVILLWGGYWDSGGVWGGPDRAQPFSRTALRASNIAPWGGGGSRCSFKAVLKSLFKPKAFADLIGFSAVFRGPRGLWWIWFVILLGCESEPPELLLSVWAGAVGQQVKQPVAQLTNSTWLCFFLPGVAYLGTHKEKACLLLRLHVGRKLQR